MLHSKEYQNWTRLIINEKTIFPQACVLTSIAKDADRPSSQTTQHHQMKPNQNKSAGFLPQKYCPAILLALILSGCGMTNPPSRLSESEKTKDNTVDSSVNSVIYRIDDHRSSPTPRPPVALQVAYRIDENRHFEIEPRGADPCDGAFVYYVDRKRGIRTHVAPLDGEYARKNKLEIDAANVDYLIGPITRTDFTVPFYYGSLDQRLLPYSSDGGANWAYVRIEEYGDMSVSGSFVYDTDRMPGYYEFRRGGGVGKFFDIDNMYRYYGMVWVPYNQNVKNPIWNASDFPGNNWNHTPPLQSAFNIFREGGAPKIAKAPDVRMKPLSGTFTCIRPEPTVIPTATKPNK